MSGERYAHRRPTATESPETRLPALSTTSQDGLSDTVGGKQNEVGEVARLNGAKMAFIDREQSRDAEPFGSRHH